ncbi:dTDP-4-dehydrorhamnose reductase [Bacillus sp. S3]|uniref:dTDP-4-dehydrorhamnose reductase n=1 Tax=Bacillus sp. S3 TaxID=486398 RepID=UPI00118889C7|nr:dTDP-4-dehydrorhamnose reductase [Bacillus sp. S3]QCJ40984.1 dTDP-4-dehydrorhamnose reductase [Bacillus sp. S3]
MKILVTGSTGQLGFDVMKEGHSRGMDMIGVGSKDLNITDEPSVGKFIADLNPDAIIHCAAYTAVDQAEDDRENCWNVNVEGTNNLVQAARKIQAKFMYISSDYVFNGLGDYPFDESEQPSPVSYYGLTKYEGEKLVQSKLSEWFIVRISWVFGKNGNNFVKTMLKLSENHTMLNVVEDQIGSPTYTVDAARLLLDMIQTNQYGFYHATNEGYCSWADFAREIFRLSGKSVIVKSISSEEYPTRAIRPKNSRLSNQKLRIHGFSPLPSWQIALKQYLNDGTNKE